MDNQPASEKSQPTEPEQGMVHEKVLQPSAALVEEMKTRQADEPSAAVQPAAAAVAPPASQVPDSTIPLPKPAASSIYPEPSRGIGTIGQPAPQSAPQPAVQTDTKNDFIAMSVMLFGAIMVVFAGLGLITWLKVGGIAGTSSTFGIIISALELLLAIGILMRRETARSIYVMLSLVLLVFSVYGTYNYLRVYRKQQDVLNSLATRSEQLITKYQNDPNLPELQKQQVIQRLRSEEAAAKAVTKNPLPALTEGYVIAIAPLVFLTRPRVKDVFS